MRADLRHAFRSLARSPLHAAAAIVTLAVGLTAVTTVASWARAVLLRPLPGVTEPERLVVVSDRGPDGDPISLSYPDFLDLSSAKELDGMLVQRGVTASVAVRPGEPAQRVPASLVSGTYFSVLGVRPLLGRAFVPEEDRSPGAPPAGVISHALWQRLFAGDSRAVGGTIQVNGKPVTVVGVAPPSFMGSFMGIATDLWLPTAQQPIVDPGTSRLTARGDRWLQAIARLRPGVTASRARASLAAVAERLARDYPDTNRNHSVLVFSLRDAPWGAQSILKPVLTVLGGLVGLVLLLVAANVANLILSRTLSRRRDMAVRLALGARRLDLVRPILAESLLLSAAAAAVAVVASVFTSSLLLRFVPRSAQRVTLDLGVDPIVVATAAIGALLAGLAVGLLPALVLTRRRLDVGLREPLASSQRPPRVLSALVALQVALSLVLLVTAGLFLKTVRTGPRLDPGFRTSGVVLAPIDLFTLGYSADKGRAFLTDLLDQASHLPGAQGATLARRVPLGFGGTSSTSIEIEGRDKRPGDESHILYNNVGPGYFAALGISLRAGRDLTTADRDGAPPVLVINETLARRYFSDRSAVGGRIKVNGVWREVVGVAADSAFLRLGEKPAPLFYLPALQAYRMPVTLVVRTTGESAAAVPAVRELLRRMDPGLDVLGIETMEDRLSESLFSQRVASSLLGVLGFAALLLSAVGLYGMIAWAVAQRTREIGVRMALGAVSGDVTRDVVGRGLRLLALGAAPGLVLALLGSRLLRSQLPGVSPSDPATYVAVLALLLSVALLAAWLPARRAASIDPASVLRGD